jgi:hypothetical protein
MTQNLWKRGKGVELTLSSLKLLDSCHGEQLFFKVFGAK